MTFLVSRRRQRAVLLVVALTVGLVSGCSAAAGPTDGPSGGAPPTDAATPNPDGAGADGYPTCDEVKAVLGPDVATLIELDPAENGVTVGSDGPSLVCSWFTEDTDGSSIDIVQYGGIAVGISRDPEYTEQSMEMLGWNVEDARVAAADAWALKVGGGYDPGEQLDALGVQVVRDGVIVVLTSGGVALQDVPKLAALTNEWALGAGVAMLELVD